MSTVDDQVGAGPNTSAAADAPGRVVTAPHTAPHAAGTTGAAVPAPKLTRRGRVRKWDRPPHPKDWRWWVGNVGKTLIAIGILMFGFVAYQLWGTAIENARAQRALENEFEELLAESSPIALSEVSTEVDGDDAFTGDGTTTVTPGEGTPVGGASEPATDDQSTDEPEVAPDDEVPSTTAAPLPPEEQNIPDAIQNGDALARIEIPRIGVNDIVVAGVTKSDLKKGPGHFPDTPLPGQLGNSSIAGHRTTYGQPFFDLDDVVPGDEIVVTTLTSRYVYVVTGQDIVSPSDYYVVSGSDPTRATLTLVTCDPKWTARNRLVVFSELDAARSGPVGEPVLNYGRPEPAPVDDAAQLDEVPDAEVPVDDAADTESGSAADTPATGDTGDTTSSGSVTGALTDDTTDAAIDGAATGVDAEAAEIPAGDAALPVAVEDDIADAFAEGWFSDPDAPPHVAFWGLLLALIGVGAYLVSRRLKRDWAGALVGIVPFLVVLYFFFQNVNRLLPPNL